MTTDVLTWHDVECGGYTADLPLWRELAERTGGPVLDIGAGSGRVALDLARHGHEVVALDREPALLAALRERAGELPVETVVADARDFSLGREFALCLAPMQVVQLLGGRRGRREFLRAVAAQLRPAGLLAVALAEPVAETQPGDPPLLPDMREVDGWVFASRPVAVRRESCSTSIERMRETVSPDGNRQIERNVIALDDVDPAQLAREGAAAGLEPLPPRHVPETEEHVASWVVILRA